MVKMHKLGILFFLNFFTLVFSQDLYNLSPELLGRMYDKKLINDLCQKEMSQNLITDLYSRQLLQRLNDDNLKQQEKLDKIIAQMEKLTELNEKTLKTCEKKPKNTRPRKLYPLF